MRKNDEAVSPVIATILMVAITVVLAAVLYVMVLGFGGGESTPTVLIQDQETTGADGIKVIFAGPTSDAEWGDIIFQLDDGTDIIAWDDHTSDDLGTGDPITYNYASVVLGTVNVYLNITDLTGNGGLDRGDYVVVDLAGGQEWDGGTDYLLRLIYNPTDDQMCEEELQT
jgi:flagellin-like protein